MTTQTGPPAVIPQCPKESSFASNREKRIGRYPELCLTKIARTPLSSKPAHGVKAEKGRRARMEDTYAIRENLIEFGKGLGAIPSRFPWGIDSEMVHQLSAHDPSTPETRREMPFGTSKLHFYAVYDGHGGNEASEHCASKMHENIREAWNNLPGHSSLCTEESYLCDHDERPSSSEDIVEMFKSAFKWTDDEFRLKNENSAIIGSTAVVALVGDHHIFIGYCGDSRAVLCRGKKAYALTVDHKPERDDETDRIQRAGGQVLFFNGPRVMGLLAMSRAIGDLSLRPYVISTPDCCIIHRHPQDELLILASDGLWDVLTNQEACSLALKCLQRAKEKGATPQEATRLTATVLTRAAMERGSRDNITVLIVDLRAQPDIVSPISSMENDSSCN